PSASRMEAIEIFVGEIEQTGFVENVTTGFSLFSARANASIYRGWAVSWADEYGYETELAFGPIVYNFIPRIIWPEKPNMRQGWEYGQLIFGRTNKLAAESLGQTSISAGLF